MATRRRLTGDQQLGLRVLNILAGCGLIQTGGSSIVGGSNYYFPQVVEIVNGLPKDPKMLTISILPGQTPDDFVAKAETIAYHLNIATVTVVRLEPPLIRLELWP